MAQSYDFRCHDCRHEFRHTPSVSSKECPKCQSKNTHPDWVVASRKIKDRFEVAVTRKFQEPSQLIIQLNKWYFVGGASQSDKININTPEEWGLIKAHVDGDLVGIAGWRTPDESLKIIAKSDAKKEELDQIVSQYPRRAIELLESIDWDKISGNGDLSFSAELINSIGHVFGNSGDHVKLLLKDLIKNLKPGDEEGLVELNKLLQNWRLHEITSISMVLLNRLSTVDIFSDMIHNEKTYEIRGNDSIHRLLERNLWILNENYWLIQSNESLRKFIGDKIREGHPEDSSKRPDFVCASQGRHLILVEIKRPSHSVSKDDLDQLERYLLLAEEYKSENFNKFNGIVIGNKATKDLRRLVKRRSDMKFMTYQDIVDDLRERYKVYLKRLEELKEEAKALAS